MRKPLERPARYRTAGAARGPAAPPLVSVEEPLTTPLSSRCDCRMAPDHRLGPKPAQEGEDSALRPSPLCRHRNPSRFNRGRAATTSANTIAYRNSCLSTSLKE